MASSSDTGHCNSYKLRCTITGHEKDVRALSAAIYPEGAIVSGSRDVTARVWVPNSDDNGFTEGHVMSGHSNFISSICIIPPSDKYPTGLIFTGSNDNHIFAYTLDSPQPQFRLSEHSDTVCALAAGKFGTLLSGSWDTTAKVWLNQKCVMTLRGHEAAVWAVALLPEQGLMLTGSADKTIKMWRTGKCERTFKGHEDCVRGLAVLNATEFLSCSNDSTIRRWLITGECSQTYYAHTNYVYALAVLPNGQDFVSCGEDRTLRVWKNGECAQTITHPSQSVWTVCCLPNGDTATGSSDGTIRVFTNQTARMADEGCQKAFEEEVASSAIPSQIGDLKTDQIPGPEVLFNPGKSDGQSIMVKDGDKITAHQWSAAEGRWVKVGDVVGSTGASQETSGKKLYKGKEYDYVFDVEIEEGKPPLKLPYNTAEDHWMAAHKFLQDNDLSPLFLDQVANFIRDQCKGVTLGTAAPTSEFTDPFTGGGRYIPGSGSAPPQPAAAPTSSMSDPFTGGGRYVPQFSNTPSTQPAQQTDPFTGGGRYIPGGQPSQMTSPPANNFFPTKSFLSFDNYKTSAILGKLKEFNSSSPAPVSEAELDNLVSLMDTHTASQAQLDLLWNLLQWPKDIVFPVLDVWRLAVKLKSVDQHFCNDNDGIPFLERLLSFVTQDNPAANHMLVFRILSNSFMLSWGERLLTRHINAIVDAILSSHYHSNKNIQIAIATLLLNYAVVYNKQPDIEAKSRVMSAVTILLGATLDGEAYFRLLVCLGTLVYSDEEAVALAKSLDLQQVMSKFKVNAYPEKVQQCASCVASVLQ